MEHKESTLLLSNIIPEQKGSLLYESEVAFQKDIQLLPVAIYEKCIIINSNIAINYCFDLKYGIQFNLITFQIVQEKVSLVLTRSDEAQWKEILRKFLNQKGFHQDFKPIKKIGKGNFASVYLAQKIQNGLKCAVKAFSKQAAFSEENGKECLIKQIEIMRKLNHNNIMKLYEVYESDNSLYIVFQLLEGGQLYDLIKTKHQFTGEQTKKVMLCLLQGLREMHSKKIMHRDLKPENILLRKKGDFDCVIADFGLAEISDEERYLFVRCGTPGYVAPEVINIKDMSTKYSPICDIFSLGLLFHLLLTKRSVFKGTTYNEILSQNRLCDFNLDAEEYQTMNTQAHNLLKEMLKVKPSERITAQKALQHPYFNQQVNEDSKKEEINQITDLVNITNIKTQESGTIFKDSCVQFKIGKENVFNGQTVTVGNFNSDKMSFVQNFQKKKNQKQSKFTQQPNQ